MFSSTPTSPITTSAITKQLCLPKHKTRHCVSCPLPSPLSPCPTVNRKMSAAAPRCVCWVGGGVTGYTHESPINCISYLCHCYDQTADRYNLRLFFFFSGPQFEGSVKHGVRGSQPRCLGYQESERDGCWCSFHFIQFRTPAHGMIRPLLKVSLFSSVNQPGNSFIDTPGD